MSSLGNIEEMWSGPLDDLGPLIATSDIPNDIKNEILTLFKSEARSIATRTTGKCFREWGGPCMRPDGELGTMVTLTCIEYNEEGKETCRQSKTWCSSGSPYTNEIEDLIWLPDNSTNVKAGESSGSMPSPDDVLKIIEIIKKAFETAGSIKELLKKWEKEAPPPKRRWWKYKDIVASARNGPLEVFIHDVDDTANIWWNDRYLWTLNSGESRGFRVNLRPGINLFWFELNNQGKFDYSLYAELRQSGRTLARLRLAGKDEGRFHVATQEIIAQ